MPNSARGKRADERKERRRVRGKMAKAMHRNQLRRARLLAKVEQQRRRARRLSPASKQRLLARDSRMLLEAHGKLSTLLRLSELETPETALD